MNKKGESAFGKIASLGIGVVVLMIVLTVGFLVMTEGKSQIASTEGTNITHCVSTACNATDELTSAAADIPGWLPIVIIASIGAILLGLAGMFTLRGRNSY